MSNEFNLEKMMAADRMDKEQRKTAVDRITDYISERFPIDESGESSIFDSLQNITRQEFLSLLQEVNANVRGLEAKDVELFPPEIKVKTTDASIIRKTEFVFPKDERRKEIMEEVVEKIKHLADQDDEQSKQAIAHTLYNAVNYLHVFPDGNGRTARLLYFLSSPHVERKPENVREMVQHLTKSRDSHINDYHNDLNTVVYQMMLRDRGLSMDAASDGDYLCRMKDTEILGFDGQYLQLLAAADVLTDEEKKQYNKSRESGGLAFDGYEFPEDVKARIKAKMDDIRTEFIRHIIEISSDPESPDWLTEHLDEAFTKDEKDGL